MSKRDRDLLAVAGITAADSATLLGRSRQAIYQGLSHRRDYFSVADATLVLHELQRRDSPKIESYVKFIADSFGEAESALILPPEIAKEQLSVILQETTEAILVLNGNVSQLSEGTPLRSVADYLLTINRPVKLHVVVPGDWVIGYVQEVLNLPRPVYTVDPQFNYLPSFVVLQYSNRLRAFFFGRVTAEEITELEARRLWEHLQPNFEDERSNKRSEAG